VLELLGGGRNWLGFKKQAGLRSKKVPWPVKAAEPYSFAPVGVGGGGGVGAAVVPKCLTTVRVPPGGIQRKE